MPFQRIDFDIDQAIALYKAGNRLLKRWLQSSGSVGTPSVRRMIAAGVDIRSCSAAQNIRRVEQVGDLSEAIGTLRCRRDVEECSCRFRGWTASLMSKAIVSSGNTVRTQALSLGLRYTCMTVLSEKFGHSWG